MVRLDASIAVSVVVGVLLLFVCFWCFLVYRLLSLAVVAGFGSEWEYVTVVDMFELRGGHMQHACQVYSQVYIINAIYI